MKAICSGGIQELEKAEEINDKGKHNDKTLKTVHCLVPLVSDCPIPTTWKIPICILYSNCNAIKVMFCPFTFPKSMWMVPIIDVTCCHARSVIVSSQKV